MAITISQPTAVRQRWPDPLAMEWRHAYPQLFDDDDLRLALSQPRNHFCEWVAAMHLFETTGAFSLIEKYAFSNHIRKRQILQSILSPQQQLILKEIETSFNIQLPDLFVYLPDRSEFWFAEVKGPGDSLSQEQSASHKAINERLGVKVDVILVRTKTK